MKFHFLLLKKNLCILDGHVFVMDLLASLRIEPVREKANNLGFDQAPRL